MTFDDHFEENGLIAMQELYGGGGGDSIDAMMMKMLEIDGIPTDH